MSDRKIGVYSGGSLTLPNDSVVAVVGYYEPHMISATDYYAFGMASRALRNVNGKELYRFGFNGKENDNEVKNDWNQQDYGMRIYDARLGRFLSVDPLTADYPSWSPYPFAMNRPIDGVDLDGMEWMPTKDKNENTTGYKWVGYNQDGSPVKDSESGGTVTKGNYRFTYSSDQKSQTGRIDIISLDRAPVKFPHAIDKSPLYNYTIEIQHVPAGNYAMEHSRVKGRIWTYETITSLLTGRSNVGEVNHFETTLSTFVYGELKDNDLFYRLRESANLTLPPTAIESLGLGPVELLLPSGFKNVDKFVSIFSKMSKYAGKGVGYVGLGYAKLGNGIFGSNFFKLHPRITTIGYADIRGLGYGQFDMVHRTSTFFRTEILNTGKSGVRNWNTIFFNKEIGGQKFSIGINPWTRTIYHEGPTFMK